MPNDNPAKSYIEAVMARADGATAGPWKRHVYQSGSVSVATSGKQWFDICHVKQMVPDEKLAWSDDESTDAGVQRLANANFTAHARQDIPTLAKMLLRAIEALEERAKALTKESDNAYNGESYQLANMLQCEADYCTQALADINALAAKGSQ